MAFEEFASLVSGICSHASFAADRPLIWTIIANPHAGGFAIKSRWKKHHAQLSESALRAIKNPLNDKSCPSRTALENGGSSGLVLTRGKGHARNVTDALIKEAMSDRQSGGAKPFYLVITAGGNGTSLEVLTALFHAPKKARDNFAVLRLPMGTGNDGADEWELDRAMNLLIKPAKLSRQGAVRLTTASGKGPFMAFNVLSLGLDAFVTNMTNRMKKKMPGDSYKLWLNIAILFYGCLYKVDFMNVRALDANGKELRSLREKLLLVAMGESGRRSYGSRKAILPDERNVCAVKQMSLFRKITLKGLLATGTHISEPEVILMNAAALEITSARPVLAQMDGETVLLEKSDFPVRFEITEPAIQILKAVI